MPVTHSPEWEAGARAEHEARNEGLSEEVIRARDFYATLARARPDWTAWGTLCAATWVYSADVSFRARLRFAWRILFAKS